ncbi:hypothetical protein K469DRAFT_723892 [Zopfia rhizophila CBS 207.26]|uniref:Uncharacterized protein n=1 Tax=Zopfia rhizophila CBS 207.26 TaxID=1314779 RepID=A0A6A6D8C0_9PEZI|nr:hypothetical protein K469DRAFT_723892 [Zopfia rhizophila CBS 207.26]
MRSLNLIIALLFAFITSSYAWPDSFHLLEARKGGNRGNSTNNSVNRACHKMAKLTHLTELAANQTKLDTMVAKGKINATEVEEIKANAANATAELQAMQANSTLVQECAVVEAHREVVSECRRMRKLNRLASLANNQTAMEAFMEKKGLNDTQMAKLQERIANATTKLQEMQANTTLTDLCAQQKANGDGGDTADSAAASATGSAQPAQSTGGAMGLTIRSMPYVFVPLLAGIFAAIL